MLVCYIYILFGILIFLMSIPLLFFNLPFEHWYGIRFSGTLNDKQLWTKTNKYAGYLLFFIGLSIIFLSIILIFFFKSDIFSFVMSIYIFLAATIFYKRIQKFINKQNNN